MADKIEVTMEDGRVVEFGLKQKMIKTSSEVGDILKVTCDFVNGKSLEFIIPNKAMKNQCALHGAEQKLGDEIAGVKEVEDCFLAVEALITRLDKGEWTKERSSNGMAGTSVLIQALVEQSGKAVEVIKAFLAEKTQGQKLALRNNPAIKPIVERIEAERTAAKLAKNPAAVVDTDAMLAELA